MLVNTTIFSDVSELEVMVDAMVIQLQTLLEEYCGWVTVFLKKCLKLDDHGVHHHLQLAHIREDGGVDQHPHGTLNLVIDMRFFLITLIYFTICGFFYEDFSCIVAVVIDILYKITSDKLLLSFIIICVVERLFIIVHLHDGDR